jgi:hypothetical protein
MRDRLKNYRYLGWVGQINKGAFEPVKIILKIINKLRKPYNIDEISVRQFLFFPTGRSKETSGKNEPRIDHFGQDF